VLLSRSRDGELAAVARLLGKAGVPTARLNADELDAADLLVDPGRRAFRHGGRWIAPTVVLKRHFCARAIEGSASPARDMFLRDSWQALAGQLAALAPAAIGMRSPGRLEQLLAAQDRRIAVPRTVVTTDPAAAAGLLGDSRRLFVKALDQHFVEASPGLLSGVFPVAVESGELRAAPRHEPAVIRPPVIVQEYVEHDGELRVYYAGGQLHGFEVGKDTAADPWLAPDRVTVRHTKLSPAVAAATRALAHGLRLRYGAFDFLVRGEVPVFLEVNPDGDWLWAERKARTDLVTQAVARMLGESHRACRASLAAPSVTTPSLTTQGNRGADGFDLISFLS
jgi:hypothetical protein